MLATPFALISIGMLAFAIVPDLITHGPRWNELGFYLIFVLVFGGAAVLILWTAFRRSGVITEGVPIWLGNPAWRDNQIRSNAKGLLWILWILAAIWNLLSSAILFIIPEHIAKGDHAVFIMLLFPLIGLALLGWVIKRTLEWHRFGTMPLQLDPFPGSIGGEVGGTIRLNRPLPQGAIAQVRLSCNYVSRRSNQSGSTRTVKWQDEQPAAAEAGDRGHEIRFCFMPPDNLPASEVKSLPRYEWTVDVYCELPGSDLDREYVIPVVKTAAPQQSSIRRTSAVASTQMPIVSPRILQISQNAQGLRLHCPALRNLGSSILGVLVGAACLAIAYAVGFEVAKNPVVVVFPIVFGIVGSLLFVAGLYTAGNSLSVVVNPISVDVTRRVFGLVFKKHIATGDISSIEIDKGRQSAQGTKSTLVYKVQIHTTSGKKVTVAESIIGSSVASEIVEQIKSACGIHSR